MISEKERLSKDRYVYSVFVSPSGNGLKALVKIPKEPENHKLYFISLEKYFKESSYEYYGDIPIPHLNPWAE
mgnify:CR=1 FL=1